MRKLTILFAALTLSVGLWAEAPANVDTELPRLDADKAVANKFFHNGQVFIRKADKTYNVLGAEL